MINPINVFVTPKVFAKIGMAGIISPNPIATRNEIVVRTDTSRGSPVKGERNFKLSTLQLHRGEQSRVLGYLVVASP